MAGMATRCVIRPETIRNKGFLIMDETKSDGAASAVTATAPTPAARPEALTEVEKTVESAFAATRGPTDFHDDLFDRGLILCIVTPGDIVSLETEQRRFSQRALPALTAGQMVAVDRFGDIHAVNLAHEADIRGRLAAGIPPPAGISTAQAAFARYHAPRPAKRKADAARAKLRHLHNSIDQAANGDRGELASALRQIATLHEDMIPTPTVGDHLRDAMRATAAGKTPEAVTALNAAKQRRALDWADQDEPPDGQDPIDAMITDATTALCAGDRHAAMDLCAEAIEKTERGEELAEG